MNFRPIVGVRHLQFRMIGYRDLYLLAFLGFLVICVAFLSPDVYDIYTYSCLGTSGYYHGFSRLISHGFLE